MKQTKLFRPSRIQIIGQELNGESSQKYYLIRVCDIPLALPWNDFLILSVLAIRLKAGEEGGWTPWQTFTEDRHCAQQGLYRMRRNIHSRLKRGGPSARALLDWKVFQTRVGEGMYRLLANRNGLRVDKIPIEAMAKQDSRLRDCLRLVGPK